MLQEILFYRELQFSLKEIRMILSSPDYDKQNALAEQKHLLTLKKERLERVMGGRISETENSEIYKKYKKYLKEYGL